MFKNTIKIFSILDLREIGIMVGKIIGAYLIKLASFYYV